MAETVFNTGETQAQLNQMYNPADSALRKGQLILFDMLCFIDDLCKENNINYSVAYGNVLGAYRHGGFIPWDDDLDIILFPKDYEKLHNVLRTIKHERYVLQDITTDAGYPQLWYKIRDKKTHHKCESNTRLCLQYDGFQIDCFPLIEGPIPWIKRIDSYVIEARNLLFEKNYRTAFNIILRFQQFFVYPFYRFLSKCFGDKTIVGIDYGILSGKNMTKSSVIPYSSIKFEERLFPCPANPKEYLECLYGSDFMCLPPREKRTGHEIDEYSFDD